METKDRNVEGVPDETGAGMPAGGCAADEDATAVMPAVEAGVSDGEPCASVEPAGGVSADGGTDDKSVLADGAGGQSEAHPAHSVPIADAIGADNDESGLDMATVPVIGPEEPCERELEPDTGDAGEGAAGEEAQSAKSHVARNIAITVIVALILIVGCFVGWLVYDDSRNASCHVPEGVTLDGTDIGGFAESEVQSVVTKHLVSGTAGSVVLKLANGTDVELDYARMGDVDVPGTVEAAMATIDPSMLDRCIERVKGMLGMGTPPQERELVTVCKLSKKRVTARVQALADAYNVEMQNAGYKFDRDKYKVTTTKARTGYAIDVDKTVKAVLAANKAGADEVQAADEVIEPTQTKPGQAIFVSLSECHLYFYVDGKVSRDYSCTPGMSGYETPSGDWTLSYKDPAPTWYNPHSDWSKNMPETIGPGASNPLGLRALEVSCGGGIYIHGTQNYAQLGSVGSHGCIRLANENVVELFDLVETGIPIFIH